MLPAKFRVLYLTEPDLPLAGSKALLAWVQAGGVLVTVAGAGALDEYDEPNPAFQAALLGTDEASTTHQGMNETVGLGGVLDCVAFPNHYADVHIRTWGLRAGKQTKSNWPALMRHRTARFVDIRPPSRVTSHRLC